MVPRVGAKTLRFVKVPLSLPPTQKARASPHEGATPPRLAHAALPRAFSEVAQHVLPPCALGPQVPRKSFVAMRRLPFSLRIPANGDFMPEGEGQGYQCEQDSRRDDEPPPPSAPLTAQPSDDSRGNERRINKVTPEEKIDGVPSRLRIGHRRESGRALVHNAGREWQPAIASAANDWIVRAYIGRRAAAR